MNHVKPAAHSLHKVTWPSFRDTVKLLARDMSETSEIRMRVRSFIPIIRGGMIPAMLLSELLITTFQMCYTCLLMDAAS